MHMHERRPVCVCVRANACASDYVVGGNVGGVAMFGAAKLLTVVWHPSRKEPFFP